MDLLEEIYNKKRVQEAISQFPETDKAITIANLLYLTLTAQML